MICLVVVKSDSCKMKTEEAHENPFSKRWCD